MDWFISSLSRDVKIIKELPRKKGKNLTPHNMRVPRKCSPNFYKSRVLPVLNKKHVSSSTSHLSTLDMLPVSPFLGFKFIFYLIIILLPTGKTNLQV